jgi:LysR family transcriptional regulator, nitrogen assimilation regulatory protein
MDSRQLRYFAAIYEHGTLSLAAQHARVAVSALSHHLANLERELSTMLFERKPRGMRATAAGERLYAHAKAILKAMEIAERDLREGSGEVVGDVSIGMAYSAVKAIAVDLAGIVLERYPKLGLVLTESLSGVTLAHLMATDVDLALVYNPPAAPGLRTVPVLEERLVCVGLRDIIGDTDAPISFQELLDFPIILLRQGLSARAILDDVALLKKIEARAKLQMNSVQAIAGSLLAGLGCVIGTRLFMQEQLQTGALHCRPIIQPELSRTLYLCDLQDRAPSHALDVVRALVLDLVRDAVRSGRWEARLITDQ